MSTHRFLAGLVAVLLMGAGGVMAQEGDCPAAHVCVAYKADTIAIDPAQGPIQALIVEERTTTIRDFDGERSNAKVKLAAFVIDGETYTLAHELTVERSGIFAGAELGSVYVLAEAE